MKKENIEVEEQKEYIISELKDIMIKLKSVERFLMQGQEVLAYNKTIGLYQKTAHVINNLQQKDNKNDSEKD